MPTREHLSIVSRLLYSSITVHYPPRPRSPLILRHLLRTSTKQILSSVSISPSRVNENARSLARARARTCAIRPDSVPCLRPWAERYYGQEHSFLTNNVLSLRTRAAIIDWDHPNSPRQEREWGRGIRPGCVLSPRQPSFLRLRHRENSTMHATKIVTGEKMPPPMTEEILQTPPSPLFFF